MLGQNIKVFYSSKQIFVSREQIF